MYANKEANGIDWGKQWENIKSPFTGLGTDKQGNTNFNYLGSALLGGGTGLVTWALGRLLGLKSGVSLTAGLLGALATSYYAFGKQKYGADWNPFSAEQGKGLYNNVKGQIDQKRYEKTKSRVSDDQVKMRNEQMLRQVTAFKRKDTGEVADIPMEISSDGSRRIYVPDNLKHPTTPPSATPNVEGMKKVGAARQRRKEIESKPLLQPYKPVKTSAYSNFMWVDPNKGIDNFAVSPMIGFIKGIGPGPAPIDITPKPGMIGGGSIVPTR